MLTIPKTKTINADKNIRNEISKAIITTNTANSTNKLSHFLAQLKAESNFKVRAENMNYSIKRMQQIFGRNGKRKKLYTMPEFYAKNPIALANYVYANRMGNHNEASGDGYKFRGRGLLQITGKNNYKMITNRHLTLFKEYIDFTKNPDLLLTNKYAVRSAICFWSKNKLDKLIDKGATVKEITKVINGGYHALNKRIKYYNAIKKDLKDINITIKQQPIIFNKEELKAIKQLMTK